MHKEYINYGSPAIRLLEEFSEVQKLICKGERFGYFDWHPDLPPTETNIKLLREEISDVKLALFNFETWLNALPEPKETIIGMQNL
jgi:hypothetical protein